MIDIIRLRAQTHIYALALFHNSAYIRIPIQEFDVRTISFTYGDSHPAFSGRVNDGLIADLDSREFPGFNVILRDENRTIDETLLLVEDALKLRIQEIGSLLC